MLWIKGRILCSFVITSLVSCQFRKVSFTVNHVVAQFLETFFIEVINTIQFLQAYQSGITLSDFFHYTWASEPEVTDLIACFYAHMVAKLVGQQVIAHHVYQSV